MTQWLLAMDTVDSLSAGFEVVINGYERNDPRSVRYSMHNKYKRIEVIMPPILGFDTSLIAYRSKSNEAQQVWYVITNYETSTVYKRDLLKI